MKKKEITFGEYCHRYIKYADIKAKSRKNYLSLMVRIDAHLGNIPLVKLTGEDLEQFYYALRNFDIKTGGRKVQAKGLVEHFEKTGMSMNKLARLSGAAFETVQRALQGAVVSELAAQKLSSALEQPLERLFEVVSDVAKLSEETVMHYHRLISTVLEDARSKRIVKQNAASMQTKGPKVRKNEVGCLNIKQAKAFICCALEQEDIRIKTAMVLLLVTGIRRSELIGLCWDDFDFDGATLEIRRAIELDDNSVLGVTSLKSDKAYRLLPLDAHVIEVVRQYKAWWDVHHPEMKSDTAPGFLFFQDGGNYLYPDTVNKWLKKGLIGSGLEFVTPHVLRHSYTSLHIALGTDVISLQSMTGHAQAAMLLKHYGHHTPEILHEFIDKIVVHHREQRFGETVQRVEIYYRMIGHMELPEMSRREVVACAASFGRKEKDRSA